jgi:hypothetical protein
LSFVAHTHPVLSPHTHTQATLSFVAHTHTVLSPHTHTHTHKQRCLLLHTRTQSFPRTHTHTHTQATLSFVAHTHAATHTSRSLFCLTCTRNTGPPKRALPVPGGVPSSPATAQRAAAATKMHESGFGTLNLSVPRDVEVSSEDGEANPYADLMQEAFGDDGLAVEEGDEDLLEY